MNNILLMIFKVVQIKLVYILSIILVLTYACTSNSESTNENMTSIVVESERTNVILCGKIDSITQEYFDYHHVYISDLFSKDKREEEINIDSLGNFTVTFEIRQKQDVLLDLGPYIGLFYAESGDSIYCEIFSKDSILYSGDNALMNNQYNYLVKHDFWSIFDIQTLSDSAFEHYLHCDSNRNLRKEYVAEMNQQVQLDKDLILWLNNHIEYCFVKELLAHPEGININDSLSEIKFENIISQVDWNDMIYSDWHHSFPSNYTDYGYYFIKPGDEYNDSIFTFYSRITSSNNLLKDILIMNRFIKLAFQTTPEEFERDKHFIEDFIDNKFIKTNLYLEYEKIFSSNGKHHLDSLNIVETPQMNDDFLESLVNKYPNKVIYLDFWTTYCGPCLKELAVANEHTPQFGEDVQFIYVCLGVNKEVWQDQMSRLGVKGDLYYLEKEYAQKVQNDYNIYGFPSYFIITKSGDIIRNDRDFKLSGEYLPPFLDSLIAI